MTKNLKKLSLSALSLFALAGCKKGNDSPTSSTITPDAGKEIVADVNKLKTFDVKNNNDIAAIEDQDIYDNELKAFKEALDVASAEQSNADLRYVKYAKAEALLLDSAIMLPTNSRGGSYAISRIAPHTIPYVFAGNDDYRLKGQVIASQILTKEDISTLRSQWDKARKGEGTYDPEAYFTSKGYSIKKELVTTWTTAPETFDAQATSAAADSEIFVNTIDNLVEYDNLGNLHGAIATDNYDGNGHPYKISGDGKTYEFKIRSDVKWVDKDGTVKRNVTADDFVAGFQHLLDAQAGGEELVNGIIKGVKEYLAGGSFADVGFKANGDVLTIELVNPEAFFPSRLAYTIFAPLPRDFYVSKGGTFGSEYKNEGKGAGTYGSSIDDILSCGAYRITSNSASGTGGQIVLEKNASYYNPSSVKLDKITFTYDSGENPTQMYANIKQGTYSGLALSESNGTLKMAKDDGTFDASAYVSDTDSTTYFGALNLKRQTHVLSNGNAKSLKNEAQDVDYFNAIQNKNFRKAILYSFNRTKFNAVRYGQDLASTNLRNMYTVPGLVKLSTEVTYDGLTFAAGSSYGDVCQKFVDKLNLNINVQDSQDGWNLPNRAVAALNQAKVDLGDKWAKSGPIQLDVVILGDNQVSLNQANSVKQSIEGTLGADNVKVNIISASKDDYYASGYRAESGAKMNMDLFWGSGWGPDFLDPSTYLDTFDDDGAGYMTRVIGLW